MSVPITYFKIRTRTFVLIKALVLLDLQYYTRYCVERRKFDVVVIGAMILKLLNFGLGCVGMRLRELNLANSIHSCIHM